MSVGNNVVKITAKTALKGNYLKAFVAGLVPVFAWLLCVNCVGLLSLVTGELIGGLIFGIMAVLLIFPAFLGTLRFIWRILFSAEDSPVSVFYYFSEKTLYMKALKLIIQFVFRILMWLLILNIPSILLYVLSKSFLFEILGTSAPIWTANLGYYSIILRNATFVLVFFIVLKFYMAPLFFVADDNIDINEAMYNSSVISRKTSIDFIGLIFSSVGWLALCILVLPLPFILPLLLAYYAVHIRFSVAEYKDYIEKSSFSEAGFI